MTRTLAVVLVVCALAAPALADVGSVRPWIGVGVAEGKKGVLIKNVMSGTPAERAGLQAGDEVLAIDKQVVLQPAELIDAVGARTVGDKVSLKVLRGGKTRKMTLVLEPRPDEVQLLRDRLMDKPAPGFALADATGPHVASTSELAGKVVVVEFFATWCSACAAAQPRLNEWHKTYADKGLRIVAVTVEDRAKVDKYFKKRSAAYTVACDKEKKLEESYWVPAIPTLVVIDKAGIVRYVDVGAGERLDGVEAAFVPLLTSD